MWTETRDDNLFQRFWRDEKENFPRWFVDGTNAKHVTWQEFKDFCDKMWKVYTIDNKALVYIEKLGDQANVHFSLLRGEAIDPEELVDIRNEVAKHFRLIFGWSGSHNRGLGKMLERIGFRFDGFKMLHGESHGKVLEWKCYVYKKPLDKPELAVLLST